MTLPGADGTRALGALNFAASYVRGEDAPLCIGDAVALRVRESGDARFAVQLVLLERAQRSCGIVSSIQATKDFGFLRIKKVRFCVCVCVCVCFLFSSRCRWRVVGATVRVAQLLAARARSTASDDLYSPPIHPLFLSTLSCSLVRTHRHSAHPHNRATAPLRFLQRAVAQGGNSMALR